MIDGRGLDKVFYFAIFGLAVAVISGVGLLGWGVYTLMKILGVM